jgi:hypothetical protein
VRTATKGHAGCAGCAGDGVCPSSSGLSDVQCRCVSEGRALRLVQTWTTHSGFMRCTYVLDAAAQTLTRNGEVIATHVTHAMDMRRGGSPVVFHGRGSSISTGEALTFHEDAR